MAKIWGEAKRLIDTPKYKMDLLQLKKDSFCSTHYHSEKFNEFKLLKGKVMIELYGKGMKVLEKLNDSFIVPPCVVHRFIALEDSEVLEYIYVRDGEVSEEDIKRYKQGGMFVEGEEKTEEELKVKDGSDGSK